MLHLHRFNEEMMESLFSCAANKNRGNVKKDITENVVQYIQIIDPKKAQNLSIVLKALNVTAEDVCDALGKGLSLLLNPYMLTFDALVTDVKLCSPRTCMY
ncbi:hypothetical protein SAY86_023629 [Trapa natans]|uniref:FH2 domain-containing protein n=1 Tax=Trapa natans TaxID=22666 RepID=A0AAN7LW31_TRANT|nr:hypothetical protein SAY86_023629 [Trapa natans]